MQKIRFYFDHRHDSGAACGPERYFHHSFPRRGRDTEVEITRGCTILSIIRDSGLITAPEIVKWQYEHEDGSPPRSFEVLQRRVCFTELAPHELTEHAKKFGSFALEFDVPVLKSLGAIPVFYIPRALAAAKGAEGGERAGDAPPGRHDTRRAGSSHAGRFDAERSANWITPMQVWLH